MKQNLRIAQFVTATWAQPQPESIMYAPINLMLEMTERLTQRGHTVTVFAPEGSHVPSGMLETLNQPPLKSDAANAYQQRASSNDMERYTIRMLMKQYYIQNMLQQAHEGAFDIIHLHSIANDAGLPIARAYPSVPVVYTFHDPIPPWRRDLYTLFSSPNQWYISISKTQRLPAPELQYAATIYNGVDLDLFPFSPTGKDGLLIVGRLLPKKGIAEAIAVAEKTQEKLTIVGSYDEEKDFWANTIKPKLNNRITHVGIVDRKRLFQYYQDAKALLMPILWEEPFGLVMIEAMACGTPVIAFRRGSVPEVVVDGKTGFIVDTVDEMVDALKNIDKIKREDCRQHVEEHFSLNRMVADYEKTYYEILGLN